MYALLIKRESCSFLQNVAVAPVLAFSIVIEKIYEKLFYVKYCYNKLFSERMSRFARR